MSVGQKLGVEGSIWPKILNECTLLKHCETSATFHDFRVCALVKACLKKLLICRVRQRKKCD